MGGVGRLSADTTDSTVAPGRRGLRSGRAGPLGAPETERPSECRSRCEAPTQQTPPGPGEPSSRQTIQRGSLRVGSAPTHPGGTPNVRRSSLAQPKHSSARPWPPRPAFEKQRLLRGAPGTPGPAQAARPAAPHGRPQPRRARRAVIRGRPAAPHGRPRPRRARRAVVRGRPAAVPSRRGHRLRHRCHGHRLRHRCHGHARLQQLRNPAEPLAAPPPWGA